MNKYKKDIRTIFQVLSFIGCYIVLAFAADSSLGLIFFVPFLATIGYSIFNKLNYKRKLNPKEIRFPMENDEYRKYTSVTLGSFGIVGALVWFFFMTEFDFAPVLLLLSALLVMANGILDLPSGELKVEELRIKLPGIRNIIYLREVVSIHISQTSLIVNKHEMDPLKLDRLNLDEPWTLKITEFLRSHLSSNEVKIETWIDG